MEPEELGRIAAQTAKQVIIQKIREAEQDVLLEEYRGRIGTLINGTVQRFEGPNVVINLGKVEGVLPRSEQIYSESYQPGDRLRLYICDVQQGRLQGPHRGEPHRPRSRPAPVRDGGAGDSGKHHQDPQHRARGGVPLEDSGRVLGPEDRLRSARAWACAASRIKNIVEELGGEKIDIVRWSDRPQELVAESLKPAKVGEIYLDQGTHVATVVVDDTQLSLAIGRRGQNVRLASRLSGWDIEITSQSQLAERATESYRGALEHSGDRRGTGGQTLPPADTSRFRTSRTRARRRSRSIEGIGSEAAAAIMERLRKMAEEYASGGEEGDERASCRERSRRE